MFNTIVEAAKNFCTHQIRDNYLINEDFNKSRTLIAYIDIDSKSGQKHRVYLSAEKSFIQRVSYILLEEKESDDETLQDMLLETTNLIVGSAKVLAEESGEPYTIQTPFFEKEGLFDYKYDNYKTIQVNNDKLSIAIKEL